MKAHPEFNEKWLQQQIASDVTLLGLRDLDAKDIERRQPGFGRLDMLLFDPESSTRYEVEIQPGATDESHIKLYGIESKVWTVRKPSPVNFSGPGPAEVIPVVDAELADIDRQLADIALTCGRACQLELFGVDAAITPDGPVVNRGQRLPHVFRGARCRSGDRRARPDPGRDARGGPRRRAGALPLHRAAATMIERPFPACTLAAK